MNKNIVSIFAGHDSNISFYNSKNNTYHVIELERLLKKDISGYTLITILKK